MGYTMALAHVAYFDRNVIPRAVRHRGAHVYTHFGHDHTQVALELAPTRGDIIADYAAMLAAAGADFEHVEPMYREVPWPRPVRHVPRGALASPR